MTKPKPSKQSEGEGDMRQKYFSGTVIRYTGGFDEDGIPYVAYDNTEGDTPIKAVQDIDCDTCLVTFKKDKYL